MASQYELSIPKDDLSPEAFLACASLSFKKLDWEIDTVSPYGIIGFTKFAAFFYSSQVTVRHDEDSVYIKSENISARKFDWGRNKGFVNLFLETFLDVKTTTDKSVLQEHYEEIIRLYDPEKEDILVPETYHELHRQGSVFQLFIPSKGYIVTPVIIALNILYFVLMVINGVHLLSPTTENILSWGGNYGPNTLNGEWWRLLSCTFVHKGMLHLLMNMYALLYIGSLLEPLLGSLRFAIACLLTGITSSLLSLYIHPDIVSAGASGAVFGMFGVFLSMLTTNFVSKAARNAILPTIAIYIGYNLIKGLKEGIDNAGHIGGLIGGVILGYSFYPSLKNQSKITEQITITIAIVIVIIVAISTLPFMDNTTRNLQLYGEKYKKFVEFESMALEVYNHAPTNKEQLLNELQNRGIYYWDECTKVITDADQLELPKEIHERDKKILEYCALRRNSYDLIYQQIKADTAIYQKQIDSMSNQIESIITSLAKEQQ